MGPERGLALLPGVLLAGCLATGDGRPELEAARVGQARGVHEVGELGDPRPEVPGTALALLHLDEESPLRAHEVGRVQTEVGEAVSGHPLQVGDETKRAERGGEVLHGVQPTASG